MKLNLKKQWRLILQRLFYTSVAAVFLAGCAHAGGGMPDGLMFRHDADNGSPTIVLVHDWFGDSTYYREFGERLAKSGYSVIGSDLYNGASGAETHAGAWALLKDLTEIHAANIIDNNISLAASGGSEKIVVIGFSAGAPHALSAAIRNAEKVHSVIIYYGDTTKDTEQLSQLRGPVLAIYGSKDSTYGEVSAADDAAAFSKAADEVGKLAEIHIYPGAHHAFAQPLFNEGKTYDPQAAESAWIITADFLSRM